MSTIWKELLGQLVRKGLVVTFGVLVSHTLISQDLAARITDTYTGDIVVFLLAVVPVAWGIGKLRFNRWYAHFALQAAPGTPAEDVKREVIKNISGVTSV